MGGIPSGPLVDIGGKLKITFSTLISKNVNLLNEKVEFSILSLKLLFR